MTSIINENLSPLFSRCRVVFAILVILFAVAPSTLLLAQDDVDELAGEKNPTSLVPKSIPKIPAKVKRDFMYVPDAEGKIRPIPVNVTLENFLDWLDEGDTLNKAAQPAGVIQNFVCQGDIQYSANRTPWAFLNSQLEIEVRNSPRWQFLLLDMREATLGSLTEKDQKKQEEGLILTREGQENQWILWYRNREQINVSLSLLVPLEVTGDQTKLTFSAPKASRTELQLQVDQKNIDLELKSKGFEKVEPNKQGALITVKGFNQLVDLLWSPHHKQSGMSPVFNVDTQIDVNRGSDLTTILAQQNITMERGTLTSIKIHIPPPFNIDNLQVDPPAQYSIGTDRSIITLVFQQPVETAAQINWKLTAPIRKFESELLLEGFEVANAKTETGKIGIQNSNEWRIGQIPAKSKNIHPMNVRDLTSKGSYSQAFRYYGQPWQLALKTQKTESRFALDTFYNLHAQKNSLKLTADFEITPSNGTIDAVHLQWSELDSDFWTIEEIVQGSTGKPIKWSISSQSSLLELPDWEKKDFIRLVASRTLPDTPEELMKSQKKLPFTLPKIAVPNSHRGRQILKMTSFLGATATTIDRLEDDNVSPESLSPETLARKIYDPPENQQAAPQSWFTIGGALPELELGFEEIIQKIACESDLQIERIDSLHHKAIYRQRLRFTVSHLPLKQIILRYSAKKLISDAREQEGVNRQRLRLQIFDQNGVSLKFEQQNQNPSSLPAQDSMEPTVSDSPSDNLFLVIDLERPILGEKILEIRGEISFEKLPNGRVVQAEFPLCFPLQTDHYQLQLLNRSVYQIELQGEQWEPKLSEDENVPSWIGSTKSRSVKVQINFDKSRLDQHAGFVDGQMNTWISADGKTISELAFDLARTPPLFLLKNPEEFNLLSAYWVPPEETEKLLLKLGQDSSEFSLLLPEKAVGLPGRLVITIQHRDQRLSFFRTQKLSVPQHSLSAYVAWLRWRVHLPDGVYLFSPPRHLSSAYYWTWKQWGFRRVESTRKNPSAKELTATGLENFTNSYAFTSVGWPQQIEIRCVKRGLLMAIGAGIPFLIAVLFSGRHRDNQLRGVVLLFVIAITVTILFPEQIAVLAQPAVIGIFFTLLATWIAGKLRSHQEDPTIIIVGPSHQQGTELSPEPNHAYAGADEVTRIQPPPLSSLKSSQ